MIHQDCKACSSSHTEVLESRMCANGTRRRRFNCQSCGHRWTHHDGPKPKTGAQPGSNYFKKGQAPLTEDQVRMILERRDLTNKALADQLGRSSEAIRQVRIGKTYRDVLPDMPRMIPLRSGGVTCYTCEHWRGDCTMGFPDPLEEGPGFARDCDFYAPAGGS